MSFDAVRYSEAGRRACAAGGLSSGRVLVVVWAAKRLRVATLLRSVASLVPGGSAAAAVVG